MTEQAAEPVRDGTELTSSEAPGPAVSVLSGTTSAAQPDSVREPACFADLNLDQLLRSVIAGREDYDLQQFFYTPLVSPAHAEYRQAVFRDLDRPEIRSAVDSFTREMRDMRDRLSQARSVHHVLQKSLLFLGATMIYGGAVESLASVLSAATLTSAGMVAFRDYLACHRTSAAHSGLRADAHRIERALARIRYTLHIRGNRGTVASYQDETDYTADVRATFARFSGGEPGAELRPQFPSLLELDHVEAGILERVAALFPSPFAALTAFFDERQAFTDPVISRFDREAQFYLAYLDYLRPVRAGGLPFCYPRLSEQPTETKVSGTFDIVLAAKLVAARQPVICNDIRLTGAEQLLIVTGPNQAGKTTYARTFGQAHYLASLGCPVPGTAATLHLADQILTHFGRGEGTETRGGKLHDDLIRLREILDHATSRSVVIFNEIFTSTTLADALGLCTRLAQRVTALGCRCLWVTFLDELSRYGPQAVSVVAVVSPDDATVRTFRLERRPADGCAYAEAVARQYGLSYEQVRARVVS